MRRPSTYTSERAELEINMTPMIDVIFLLMVFFVWTASFQVAEEILPSQLSAARGTQPSSSEEPPPPEADFDKLIVRLLWDQGQLSWRINDVPATSLLEVRQRLEAVAAIKRDAPLILHPDPDVPLGAVIDVYDASRLIGFAKVQFAATEAI